MTARPETKSFKGINWWRRVKHDPDSIVEALKFFDAELEYISDFASKIERGENLERLVRLHASHYSYYLNLTQQLEQLEIEYNRKLSRTKATIMKEWEKNPPFNMALTKKDKDYLMEDHEEVIAATGLYDEVNYMHKQYQQLITAFVSMGYSLKNFVELKSIATKHNMDIVLV
jgi:hypothetical protein